MGQCRVGDLGVRRRELLHSLAGEAREVGGRAAERGERGPARLVGERDVDLSAAGERLQQLPLRAGQILEAIGEHRPAFPGFELTLDARDRVGALAVPIPELQPVELAPVGGVEHGEVVADLARLDEARLELRDRTEERFSEARETGGRAEPVETRARERAPKDEGTLRVGRDIPPFRATAGDRAEEVVERADLAAEQRRTAREQVALHAIDLGPVRDDEKRLAVEVLQIPIEEPRDLSGVRRANQQRQRHLVSLDTRPETNAPTPGPAGHPGPERRLRGRLGLAAAAGGRAAGHRAGAVVAEVRRLGAPSGVGVGDAERSALALTDLGTAVVAHEDRLSCHAISS